MIAVARKPFRTLVSLTLALGVLMGGTLLSAVAEQSATLPPINGMWDSSLGNSFQKAGSIHSLTVDPSNNLYVAGDFNFINQTEVNGLAHWNGSTWQGYGLQPNDAGKIHKVLPFENELFAIGDFERLQQAQNKIARWNGTSFQPIGNGITGLLHRFSPDITVATLHSYSETLYIGGEFSQFAGEFAYAIGQWNGTVQPQATIFDGKVTSFASDADELIAGGYFTQIDGVDSRLARLVNNQWVSLDVGIANNAFTVYSANNTIYLVGYNLSSQTYRLYRWDGSSATSVGGPLDVAIDNLVVHGNDLYIQSNQQLLKLENDQWHAANLPVTVTKLTALASNGSTLYLGGELLVNGNPSQIVAWNGTQAQSLASLTVIDDQNVVSGDAGRPVITDYGIGSAQGSIQRWNGTSWETLATDTNDSFGLSQFYRTNNQLYSFFLEPQALATGQAASNVWRLNGTTWTSADINLQDSVNWYESGQQILAYLSQPQASQPITGILEFDGANLNPRLQPAWFNRSDYLFFFENNFYAINLLNDVDSNFLEMQRWDGQTWQEIQFMEVPKARYSLKLWRGQLFMVNTAGNFYEINPDGSLDEIATADGGIYALAGRDDGLLYLGGDFSTIDAAATGPIASFDGTNFRGLVSQPNGRVSSLSVDHNYVYVAGDFTKVGTVASLGVAVFVPTKQVYLPAAMR